MNTRTWRSRDKSASMPRSGSCWVSVGVEVGGVVGIEVGGEVGVGVGVAVGVVVVATSSSGEG